MAWRQHFEIYLLFFFYLSEALLLQQAHRGRYFLVNSSGPKGSPDIRMFDYLPSLL